MSYFKPPSRLLLDQEPVSPYLSDEGLLLEGELEEVAIEVTYCSNQGPNPQATSHFPNLDQEEGSNGVNNVKLLTKPIYLPFSPPRFYQHYCWKG